jgi:uncharacterized metal-binding protein
LPQRQVTPTQHVILQERGIKKKHHTDFDREQAILAMDDAARMVTGMATIC